MDISLKALLIYTILNGLILGYELAFNVLSAIGVI